MSSQPRPLVNFNSDQQCFGCGKDNPYGLHMSFTSDGHKVYSTLSVAEHLCGWSGLVHGGIIALLMDEIMSWTAIHLLQRLILTKSMNVDFLSPVQTTVPLRLEAWIENRPRPSQAEVAAVLITEGDQRCCARSRGHFALFTADSMQRRNIINSRVIADFESHFQAKVPEMPSSSNPAEY